jgi:hypothetical protein
MWQAGVDDSPVKLFVRLFTIGHKVKGDAKGSQPTRCQNALKYATGFAQLDQVAKLDPIAEKGRQATT